MEELLKEQKKTNELLEKMMKKKKDPYELLSPAQLSEETGIAENQIREIFKNTDLPVQRYIKPQRVQRKAWNEFMGIRRNKANEKAI